MGCRDRIPRYLSKDVKSVIHPQVIANCLFGNRRRFKSGFFALVLAFGVVALVWDMVDGSRDFDLGNYAIFMNERSKGYIRYPKIFGHVHMARTAGSVINRELAASHEKVCGHKGYSFDAAQLNKQPARKDDIIAKSHEDHSRARVPPEVMDEIGYEDCDFISLERNWQKWIEIAELWPLELHVPCREPLEHLMSQCNFRQVYFDCNASSVYREVKRCLVSPSRFSVQLTKIPNVTMKCFDPIPVERYLAYMNNFLESKRIVTEYVSFPSRFSRKKDEECIWKNPEIANTVLNVLLDLEYYNWCQNCMASRDNLFLR